MGKGSNPRLWKVVGDIYLVKRLPKKDVTSGGIILPDKAKKENIKAEVIGVGDKVKHDIVRGDIVIISPDDEATIYADDFEVDGEKYLFVRSVNVTAKVLQEE